MKTLSSILLLAFFFTASAFARDAVVQLATLYKGEDVKQYLISEKYDGIRAVWKDGVLRTRSGNVIHAPSWFTQALPNVWLDGELWYQRGNFEYVASTVTKQIPVDEQWQNIRYMVFDAPDFSHTFEQRYAHYLLLVLQMNVSYIQAVKQFELSDEEALQKVLREYEAKGAEGLMLHKANAMYRAGRSEQVLKLKSYHDREAKVLKHQQGKGQYANKMGALLVSYINKEGQDIRFKIGTGFSLTERDSPPAVGSIITFRHYGFTKRGVPRFASFIREHHAH
ncbi:MAG: DNA ligase [Glaciecola sp.]